MGEQGRGQVRAVRAVADRLPAPEALDAIRGMGFTTLIVDPRRR